MAGARPDAFEGTGQSGGSCPFAAALGGAESATPAAETAGVSWDAPAAARLERIPSFIRPMAQRSIERFAKERGYTSITEGVMDEARAVFGM
jgi:hypothetical protein